MAECMYLVRSIIDLGYFSHESNIGRKSIVGRGSWSDRFTVEDSLVLDVSWLRRNDYFCGFKGGIITWKFGENITSSISINVNVVDVRNAWARLQYKSTDRGTGDIGAQDYKISLVATRCNYGSVRWWFVCPVAGCGRKVGKLCLPPGARYFGCRKCYNLTYESCRESNGWGARFARKFGMTPGQLKKSLQRT